MSNTIKLKRGTGSDPGSSALSVGEVALRTDNGKLFTKKDDGSVVQIGGGAGAIDDDAVTTAKIADGAVTNAKVASDAAIALSKLATGTLPSGLKVNHNNLQTGIIENENISSSAAIAGSKISPTFTSDVTVSNNAPAIFFTDGNENPDYALQANQGIFTITDTTNSANRVTVSSSVVDVNVNLDANSGLDVTGSSKLFGNGSASVEWGDTSALGHLTFSATDGNPIVRAVTNKDLVFQVNQSTTAMTLESDGTVDIGGNLDVGAGIDVTGDITATGNIDLPDSSAIKLGTGDDLQILHNGSDSLVRDLGSGGLYLTGSIVGIRNSAANEDGLLFTENAAIQLFFDNTKRFETTSGGAIVTGDLDITGTFSSAGNIKTGTDTGKFFAGASNDLQIYHDGSNSAIQNGTGYLYLYGGTNNIYIRPKNDEDGIVAKPNGAVELYYDGTQKLDTRSSGVGISGDLFFADSSRIYMGSSNDFQIFHDGTNTNIVNSTGTLTYRSDTHHFKDKDNGDTHAKFIHDGAVELYHDNSKKLETFASGLQVTGRIEIPDGSGYGLRIGDSSDLQIYHDGSHSYIDGTTTGDLYLRSTNDDIIMSAADDIVLQVQGSETGLRCNGNGAVELYYDNTKRFETKSYGAFINGHLQMDDNSIIKLGNSSDLQIYHAGGTANKIESGSNTLYIAADDLQITNAAISEACLKTFANGAVELYHNNSKKFETTSAGVTVSGNISVSGTVDGRDVASDGSKLDGIASGATNVTNNNQLSNGAGYITSVSGQNYNSLSNLPTIPTNNNQLSNGAGYITSVSGQNYNLLSNRPTIPTNNNQLSNGAGYITSGSNRAAQAYVNFTGDGTPSIRDDVNVSSISDNGTGLYTVNFSSSMPNSSYCVSTGFANSGNSNVCKVVEDSLSTSSFQLRCGSYQDGSGNTNRDFHSVYCSIFAG